VIKRPVKSGWGGDAVVCSDSEGGDRGGSGEPAQHDSVHRPVDLGRGRSRVRLAVGCCLDIPRMTRPTPRTTTLPRTREQDIRTGVRITAFLCSARLHPENNRRIEFGLSQRFSRRHGIRERANHALKRTSKRPSYDHHLPCRRDFPGRTNMTRLGRRAARVTQPSGGKASALDSNAVYTVFRLVMQATWLGPQSPQPQCCH
jgi:hypothetical protein